MIRVLEVVLVEDEVQVMVVLRVAVKATMERTWRRRDDNVLGQSDNEGCRSKSLSHKNLCALKMLCADCFDRCVVFTGSFGCAGRRSAFLRSANVASVPVAHSAPDERQTTRPKKPTALHALILALHWACLSSSS